MRDNLAGSLEAEEEVNRALSSHSRVPGQLTLLRVTTSRRLLDVRIVDVDVDSTDDGTSDREPPDNPQERQERTTRCPACKHGQMIQIFTLKPGQALPAEFVVQFHDTS